MEINEKIKRAFNSHLGCQCNELFSTSDNRVFIRYSEADKHRKGLLDPDTKPLENQTIKEWFDEETWIEHP